MGTALGDVECDAMDNAHNICAIQRDSLYTMLSYRDSLIQKYMLETDFIIYDC